MDVAVLRIGDIEYTIIDVIEGYTYLVDLDNPNDFAIMKDAGEDLVTVTDENEFEKALELYRRKISG